MNDRDNPTWRHSGDKEAQLWKAIHYNGERIDSFETTVEQTVTRAVKEAMPNALLSSDEYHWVKLAIKREEQTIAFRQSVIDKTLTGLLWALILGVGIILKEYFAAHGWKL